jgi:hypothetical protein
VQQLPTEAVDGLCLAGQTQLPAILRIQSLETAAQQQFQDITHTQSLLAGSCTLSAGLSLRIKVRSVQSSLQAV